MERPTLKQLGMRLPALAALAFATVVGAAHAAAPVPVATINEIRMVGAGNEASLSIAADKPLVYSYYKVGTTPKGMIEISDAKPGDVPASIDAQKGNIRKVSLRYTEGSGGSLTRVEVDLEKDGVFLVKQDPADKTKLTVVSVPLPESQQAAAQPVAPQSKEEPKAAEPQLQEKAVAAAPAKVQAEGLVLRGVRLTESGIEIATDGAVGGYTAFRLTKPERLVIDIAGAKNGIAERVVSLRDKNIRDARIGTYPDKTRIVVDAAAGTFADYRVDPVANGLKVDLHPAPAPAPAAAPAPVAAVQPPVVAAPAPVLAAPVRPAAVQDEPRLDDRKEPKPAEPVKEAPPAPVVQEEKSPAAPAPAPAAPERKAAAPAGPGAIAGIDYSITPEGFSRVAVKISGECSVDPFTKNRDGFLFTLKNCALPKKFQRQIKASGFGGVVQNITPYQVRTRTGNDARLLVKVRGDREPEVKREGDLLLIDFENPVKPVPSPLPERTAAPAPEAAPVNVLPTKDLPMAAPEKSSRVPEKKYNGRRVTLEFVDADVRKIFQLIAEVSNLNFLIGDDVTGTISIKLVNVPWDQALDVILETKGLAMKRDGNIVQIMPRNKMVTAEDEERAAKKAKEKAMDLQTEVFDINYASVGDVVTQFGALKSERGTITQDTRTNRVIVKDIAPAIQDMKFLLRNVDLPERQVMIEARIVEASSTFTRDLGVQWGLHFRNASAPYGINQFDTGFGGLVQSAPTAGTSGPGAAAGISFGTLTSNIQLDLRLSAAATAGQVKIISTPRVATLNNKAAKISQGQQIPYQNTTSQAGAVTQFVEAALTLEVTPHINANGTIVMKVKASNNSPGSGGTPPPINTKEATTELLIKDGETTVIGGIYVDNDTDTQQGVPFLMDIPLLGHLFKSSSKTKTKTELLIFITPRILS